MSLEKEKKERGGISKVASYMGNKHRVKKSRQNTYVLRSIIERGIANQPFWQRLGWPISDKYTSIASLFCEII